MKIKSPAEKAMDAGLEKLKKAGKLPKKPKYRKAGKQSHIRPKNSPASTE